MTVIKLYKFEDGKAEEVLGQAAALERSLHLLIEQNLKTMLGIQLLESEYSIGSKYRGRIDMLGIDENKNPVIIEYKRATNQNIINQGLFYLDWLLDHRAEFRLLVQTRLGEKDAKAIDWSAPRLLCIAGGFTRYDEHAVQQMNRNIELIRYRSFGEKLLMLELVNATSAQPSVSARDAPKSIMSNQKTISETLTALDDPMQNLYHGLRAHIFALGDDIQEKTLRFYVVFKRLQNFACVEKRPNKATLLLCAKVDPERVILEPGFSRDVRNIGHFGTGDLEITIRAQEDLERANPLLQTSYEAN